MDIMSKLNIDEILMQQASQLNVSTPIIESINPWEKPINRICFGMVFTTVTIQFLYLDLILQTIGYCLLFLGFYAIKNQNTLFKLGFYVIITQIIYYFYSFEIIFF